MKISVIIPHYFSRQSLPRLLKNLMEQEVISLEWEVLVVVDHSKGISPVLKETFPSVRWFEFTQHVGTARAKNAGAREARGDWLVFLDDDVTLESSWLSSMARAATRFPQIKCFQAKVLFENSRVLNSTGGVANLYGYSWDRGVFEDDLGQFDAQPEVLFATSCAMMISKSVFCHIGGFDEDFFYMGEDYDVGLRLHLCGESVRFVPEAVCYHTRTSDEKERVLHSKYYLERNRLLILLKNYPARLLIKSMLLLPFLKAFKYGTYLFQFKRHRLFYFKEIVRGWAWLVWHLPRVLKKRRHVAALTVRSLEDVFQPFSHYRNFLGSVREMAVHGRVPMTLLPRQKKAESASGKAYEAHRRLS